MEATTNTPARMGAPGTYHIVAGEPSVARKDMHIANATFAGLVEFVQVRKAEILDPVVAADAHLTVCERTQTIELVMGEHGGFRNNEVGGIPSDYVPSNKVTAVAKFSDDHKTVTSLLSGSYRAENLAEKVRSLRHLFGTKADYEALFKRLRNTQHKVERIVESTSNDLGARKKGFDEQIVNAEVIAFQFRYAIHEGEAPRDVNVEVVYSIQGGDVVLQLLAMDLELDTREAVKLMIDNTIKAIREVTNQALPIVRLN